MKLGGEEIDECADLVAWRSSRRQRVEIGVIGVGKWALTGPIRIFDLLAQSEISAIYSQRLDAAHDAAAKYNIKNVVASLDDLVNHPDIDLLLVLTTGQQLEVAVRAAIAAGKTVYCEWPLTPSAKTSAELAALAGSAGVRTILGTQRRFSPAFFYARDLLAEVYVGRVRSVRMAVSIDTFGKTRLQAARWSVFP